MNIHNLLKVEIKLQTYQSPLKIRLQAFFSFMKVQIKLQTKQLSSKIILWIFISLKITHYFINLSAIFKNQNATRRKVVILKVKNVEILLVIFKIINCEYLYIVLLILSSLACISIIFIKIYWLFARYLQQWSFKHVSISSIILIIWLSCKRWINRTSSWW